MRKIETHIMSSSHTFLTEGRSTRCVTFTLNTSDVVVNLKLWVMTSKWSF